MKQVRILTIMVVAGLLAGPPTAQAGGKHVTTLSVPHAGQQKAATQAPFPGLKTWDLLFMSDSSNWNVGAAYAKLIKANRHVKVRLHDCWIANSTVRQWLDRVQSNAAVVPFFPSPTCKGKWQDQIRAAEVIVVFGGPLGSEPVDGAWDGPDSWPTLVLGTYRNYKGQPTELAAYQASLKKSCAPETFARYNADLGKLYDTIFELRGARPIIMRSTDFYIPGYAAMQKVGLKEVLRYCIGNFSAAIHEAAGEHKVLVGSSFDALNGKDHRSDPSKYGYVQYDGIHPSPKGGQLVAKALYRTGYGYAGT